MSARPFRSAVALVLGALVVSPMAIVVAPAAAAGPCDPYSPLDCGELVVDATGDGYRLDFDGADGGLGDGAGVGTGFTLTQPSTSGSYRPELLEVADGALRDTTTPGIQYLTNNTLDNGLGVAVATPAGELDVRTRIIDVPAGSSQSEQAGVWLGSDQDNLVKLVAISRLDGRFNIQLAREVAGAVGSTNEINMANTVAASFPAGSDVDLRLLVDPVTRTATGQYSVDGGDLQTIGALPLPAGVLDAVNPALEGAGLATGVFSTQRNRSASLGPVVYSFDSFSVTEGEPAPAPDTEAPAAPAALRATAGTNAVELDWDAVAVDDLAGYFVYRSTTADVATTGAALNGAVPLTDTTWTDPSGFLGTGYSYAVVAVDAAGNRSEAVTAGPVELTRPAGERVLAVDFLKDTAPVDGYTADTGAAFDDERGFGWLDGEAATRTPIDASVNTRTRAGVSDPRTATLNHMQFGDVSTSSTAVLQDIYWEAELPAGRYAVTATAGDVKGNSGFDSRHVLRAEGTQVLDFVGSDDRLFDEATVEVEVTDGLLTVDAVGGTNTKITHLEVVALEEFDTAAPAVPADVTATAGDARVELGWSAVADEDLAGYRVYRVTDGAPATEALATVDAPATSFTDTALTNGTAYSYVVTAVDTEGNESAVSAVATATPAAAGDSTAPAAPTGLTATSDSTGVGLSWVAPTDSDVVAYRVYRAEGTDPDTDGTPLATVAEPVHLDTDVTAGTEYRYAVTAVDAADNESAASGTATVTLDTDADETAPGAPTALTAALDGTTATLAWQAPDATDVAGYQVIRRGAEVAAGVWDEQVLSTVTGTGAVVSNLQPGTSYTFVVRAVDTSDNASAASSPVTVTVPVASACTAADGWNAEYFANTSLAGAPAAVRCDAAIAFDYGDGGPAGLDAVDDFSARWTRDITTVAGTYAISSRSDDGLRITVDGETVVDEWVDRGASAEPAVTTLPLTAGTHTVVVEYYENGGGALVEVDYALVEEDTDAACVPGQWQAQYFDGRDNFSGTPAGQECVEAIDEDWGSGGPEGVGSNDFSVRWTSTRTLEAGTYELQARSDDGIRIFVDGDLALDAYSDHGPSTLYTEEVVLGAGEHTFRVDYYENGGGALARVGVSRVGDSGPVACPDGWTGEYFDNQSLDGTPVRTACDAAISYDYALGGPAGVGVDDFSVRWTREITTEAGTYAFSGRSDDGLRVTVDGLAVIDEFYNRGAGEPTVAEVPLTAGTHTVVVEYYENDGGALVDVSYALVDSPSACEPGSWTAQYFEGRGDFSGTPAGEECVEAIDEDWGSGGPEGVGSNDYSVRWTTTRTFEPGSYRLSATADDGIRAYVDGELVLDEWRDQGPTSFSTTVPLEGEQTLVVEYYENGGGALARFDVERLASADLPPAAPATLAATVVEGSVVLDWAAVEAADLAGYRVYRSEGSPVDLAAEPLSGATPLTVTTFTDATAVPGTEYTYAVVAVDAADQASAASPEASATVLEEVAQVLESWNFQPATAPVPAGFTAETGAAYSTATGRGWVTEATVGTATPTPLDLTRNTRDRERAGIAQELDTMIHLQYGSIPSASPSNGVLASGGWERDLPNGTYQVSVSMGDQGGGANGYDSSHVVRAEGQVIAPTFVGSAAEEYRTATSTVVVNDGRLSIDAIGGSNTKLNWIRIASTGPDTTAPAKVADLTVEGQDSAVVVGWQPSASADVAGYRVYRSESLPVPVEGLGIAGADLLTGTSFTDTTATNLTTYRYAVVAVDAAGNRSEVATSAEVTPQPFQGLSVGIDFGTATMTPATGHLLDYGQAYGARVGAGQGSGLTYGWVDQGATTPLSLVGNGRVRERAGIDPILNSVIHVQYGDIVGTNGVDAPGAWEIQVPDGVYEVSVTAGDEPGNTNGYDSTHVVNIENQVGIESFQASAAEEYRTTTAAVRVEDGRLTVSALGGTNTKLTHLSVTQLTERPAVASVNPLNRATDASTTAGVATSIAVPGDGVGVDPATISGNVSLVEVATGRPVEGTSGSSGGNDVINFSPTTALKPVTAYRFTITSDVRSEDGTPFEPFTSVFTTGDGVIVAPETFTPVIGVGFEKVRQDVDAGYIASMQFGPDGKLYTSSIGGSLTRYDVAADGSLSNPQPLASGLLGRAVIGLLFDEAATADDLGVWVTHATADLGNEQSQWSSKVSYLSGPNLETVTDVFVNLPRSNKDHLSNSIGYGPGGDLYFLQGSNQAAGDPDGSWGTRGEKLLTATLLHFDPDHAAVQAALAGGSPINVQTDGVSSPYDPYASGAPLKIHATGIRNAYDFTFHSNGHIYVPTNGTASGGNSPGVDVTYTGGVLTGATRIADSRTPGAAQLNGQNLLSQCQARIAREPGLVLQDTPAAFNHPTQRDPLFDVTDGGYFGHPNPERCEFVLNGGSASPEGIRYTGSVPADPNYRGVAYDFAFNKSPNGVIEYQSGTFGGQLRNRLVVVRFSNNDDLTFLQVDQNTGAVLGAQVQEGITGVAGSQISGVGSFNDPLEVVEDPRTGNLYVNSYDRSGGQQGLFLLRVPQSQQAPSLTTGSDELVFEAIRGSSDSQQVVVTNSGSEPVTLASAITGTDAATFAVQSGGSGVLQAGASTTVSVRFTPGTSTTVGYREARLSLTAGDSTVGVGLYGLSKLGQEGSNEPTLANVLRTLGHPVNTGWSGLAGGVDPAPKGDEIEVELFQKAGTADVTMTPIAAYAPFEVLPFGWYTGDGDLTEVGALASDQLQTLYPTLLRGGTTFDPGTGPFGLYYDSNTFNRVGYTEDRLNAAVTPDVAHRVRIYPATRRDGSRLPNAYVVAFEDAANGDYQDYVFLLSGVRPAGAEPEPEQPQPANTIKVNFQSAAAPVPDGYVRDYGQPFGSRTGANQGTGLRYGWIDPATEVSVDLSVGGSTPGNGRDRDVAGLADQRLDTLMHMQATDIAGSFNGTKADGAWEIEVPNGRYTVTVAAGDPTVNTSDQERHSIDVEDVRAIDSFVPSGTAGSSTRSQTATVEVEVIDERLSLNPSSGFNTKVQYVDIVPVAPEEPDSVQVNFQAAGAATPEGWQADTGLAFTEARGYGWLDLASGAPVDRTSAARTRTGSGSVLDRTFNIMQSDVATTAAPDGAWEFAVPDGAYNVQVSVGDPGYADSVHSVDAEGVRVISEFVPAAAGDYQVSDETVNVSDGRLTITPGFGGSNTKIQWIRITGADLVADTTAPVVDVQVSGDAAPGGAYYDEALVTVAATDAGGSGLGEVTVSVDGADATPYTDPVPVTGAGTHTVTVVATDGAGNVTTETVELEVVVVELGDGVLTSQNPEAAPFADRYVMSRTESTVQSPTTKDTTTVVLRNTGTEPVVVSGITPPGEGFELTTVPTFPVTVPVDGTLQVGVRFTGTSPTSINRVFEDSLTLLTDAANGPAVRVEVAGIAQDRAEGGTEPNNAQIAQAFGLGTDILDPASTRSAAQQLNNQGRVEALGDEVLSPYWQRLNTSQPVTVRQLAAYHSCCASTATFFTHAKGSNTVQNRLVHNGAWAQSLLPRINGSATNPALASFTPPAPVFGFRIDGGEWSDPAKNNKSADQCVGQPAGVETETCKLGHHVRIWPVEDRDGVAVPGQYLVTMDYSGINYDFNDNVYLVTNIVPEGQADTTAPAAPATATATLDGTEVDVTWAAVPAADLAGYLVERSSGTTWTPLTTTPVTGTSYTDTTAPAGAAVSYRVVAVDASGNRSAATSTGTVTVPAPEPGEFEPVRVNAGGPAVTTGGVSWAADAGFSGGKPYTNPSVTSIAGTTDDELYRTERSATTNLGSFGYGFGVPAGEYTVRLHFAEIYFGATGGGAGGTGKRVFSVNAEGGAVEVANLDLNAVASPMTAVVREFTVPVTDGTLNLAFSASVNQPKVSAIEVVAATAPPADTTPPAAPAAPAATAGAEGVALTWAAVADADLTGYRVERQRDGGAFTSLTPDLLTGTSFTDATAPVGVPVGYRVLAVDGSGNVSTPSPVTTLTVAPPADTTAPAAPTGVTATVAGTGVQLAWSAVAADDLAGYHVERSTGGAFVRLTTEPTTATGYSDAAVPTGVQLGYRVLAVDTAGNVSDPSATATATVANPTPGVQPIRVNTGGPALTLGGVTWSADTGSTGGKAYSNPAVTAIAGTSDDALYLDERSATSNLGSFSYAFARPNGEYLVRLHFAELYHGATGGGAGGTGKRVFSANAEGGAAEVADLDLNAVASPMTAVVREFPVAVADGTLDLAFSASVNQPTVAAIEVLPVSVTEPPAPAFDPIRVNTGGPAVTTGGVDWLADLGFSGGKSYTNPAVTAIAGTTDDALYVNERSATTNLGSFGYGFAVPAGTYRVRLHFAELFHGATGGGTGGAGKRVFSANAEGGAVEVADLDLNAVAAPMTAVVREFDVPVTDGTLDLAFTASVNQPTVSAVEIIAVP